MFQNYPVRLHVNSVAATDDLFAPASDLRDIDAICIDFDKCLENNLVDRCFRWIDKGNEHKVQVFLLGSREHLLEFPTLQTKDVTFVEKTEEMQNSSGEMQAEILSQTLEEMYQPFTDERTGYVSSGANGGDFPFERKIKKTIDPAYFQRVLTDEQDQALLAFLRTSESQQS